MPAYHYNIYTTAAYVAGVAVQPHRLKQKSTFQCSVPHPSTTLRAATGPACLILASNRLSMSPSPVATSCQVKLTWYSSINSRWRLGCFWLWRPPGLGPPCMVPPRFHSHICAWRTAGGVRHEMFWIRTAHVTYVAHPLRDIIRLMIQSQSMDFIQHALQLWYPT